MVPHVLGYFFISNICNHQGTHIKKAATDTVTNFNLIYDFNWPRKHHTATAEWSTLKKLMITICDESEDKLFTPLGQWIIDDNKYIKSWKCFISQDLHILYYKQHRTWCKYTQPPN